MTRAQQVLAFAPGGFGPLAFGNVARENNLEPAIRRIQGRNHDFQRNIRAVKPARHPFEAMSSFALGRFRHFARRRGGGPAICLRWRRELLGAAQEQLIPSAATHERHRRGIA